MTLLRNALLALAFALASIGHAWAQEASDDPPWNPRLYCVEGIESAHGRYMWNPVGLWYGDHIEHAQGWLGFMPTTARTWGADIGDRVSEWAAAERMIAAGYGRAFYGIAAGIC